MNIIIGNQKGGVGKSTFCILLANYLSLIRQSECLILDLDFQGSIRSLWEKDRANFDNPPLYEVLNFDLTSFEKFKDQLQQVAGHIIIDLPGKMDDNALVPVYQSADLVLCPFSYDKICFESTGVFAQVIRHLNKEVPMVFIPNRIKAGVKYEILTKVNEVLSHFGTVTATLPDRVAFQRLDTLSIPPDVEDLLKLVFDPLYDSYLNRVG